LAAAELSSPAQKNPSELGLYEKVLMSGLF